MLQMWIPVGGRVLLSSQMFLARACLEVKERRYLMGSHAIALTKCSLIQNCLQINSFARDFQVLQESSYESKNLGSTGGSGIDSITSVTTSIGRLPVCQRGSEVSNDKLCKNKSDSVATNHTSQSGQSSESDRSTPLGLGLGDLQPKVIFQTLILQYCLWSLL